MDKENSPLPLTRLLYFLLGVGIFLWLFIGFFHEISAINQDLGRHLLTGKLILQEGFVPKTNLYSYTYPEFPFINHHYLSEVIFYSVHSFSNFSGLLLFTTSLILFSFALIFFSALRFASFIPVAIVSFLYLPVLFERTDLRPEILSFFFLSIFIVILYKYRQKYTRLIFLLPFIELLWVNSHIYFPIGLVVFFLFIIEGAFINRTNLKNKHFLTLVVVFVLSGLTTFINPNGFSGATYPLRVFENYGYTIAENQTIFFLEDYGMSRDSFLYFKISVFLLFSFLLLTFKKSRLIDWLLSITFTIFAFMAVRNFPLFVFVTFIPFAYSLSLIYNYILKMLPKNKFDLNLYLPLLLSFFMLIFLWGQIQTQLKISPLNPTLSQGASKGIDFFEKENLTGPIFNNFDIGSYISYRLYPKEKVFIDGRPEAYPASFIQNTYIKMQEDPNTFKQVEEKYNFKTIFFSHTDQTPWGQTFLKQILKNPSWQTVYLDPFVIILVKNPPLNKENKNLTMSNLDDKNLDQLILAANFYSIAEDEKKLKEIYQKILALDPDNCPVLYNLSLLENQQNILTLERLRLHCQ